LLHMLANMSCFLRSIRPKSSSNGLRRGLLQLSHVAGSQQVFCSQPQLGAAQQGSQALTSHPQDGAFDLPNKPQPFFGAQQGSQAAISQPQLGSAPHPLSQQALSQPAPFRPSMRSRSPPPKLGVHRLAPSMRDPITMFHFIEFNSLNDELILLTRLAELGVWPRPVSTNEVVAEITLAPVWQRTGEKLDRNIACSTSCAACCNHKLGLDSADTPKFCLGLTRHLLRRVFPKTPVSQSRLRPTF
jgi:hypothetical protein